MSTTLEDVKRFLDESQLKYVTNKDDSAVGIGFSCGDEETTFRDAEGDPHVRVIVKLAEKGEFVAFFVPHAWNVGESPNRAIVCEAAARLQSRTKLIRFDLDEEGYLQPNIEIPLERAPLCAEQVHRALAGILFAVRHFDPVFRHAIEAGEVDLDLVRDDMPEPPPEVMGLLDLAEDAGGLDELDRLLGDGDAPPIEP